jgi:hypothetical protein
MELDITHMIDDADDCPIMSGSQAELGPDAAKITWNNSKAYAAEHLLLTDETMRDNARRYFKGFGAWSADEIAAWSDADLNAMVTQEIASRIREMERFDSDEEYLAAAEQGSVSGSLYKGDDSKWYAYIGD